MEEEGKDCIFCRIVKGKEDTKIVKSTENFILFQDINPQTSIHLLIVPKAHIKDISELKDEAWIELKKIVTILAKEKSLKGYRLTHNAGDAASIVHLQFHFMADVATEILL